MRKLLILLIIAGSQFYSHAHFDTRYSHCDLSWPNLSWERDKLNWIKHCIDVHDWDIDTPGGNYRGETFSKLTALQISAEMEYRETVTYLLNNGASVNRRDSQMDTPLHKAWSNGHTEICDILIQSGANIFAKNLWRLTPAENGIETGFENC